MNCPKCGVELLEHVSFCPLCGSALPDDLWQKKKAARTKAQRRKTRRPVKKAKPKTVTMRPTEPSPQKARTVTMKPVEEKPKTVTMRPAESSPGEGAPGKPPAPQDEQEPEGTPPESKPPSGEATGKGKRTEPPAARKEGEGTKADTPVPKSGEQAGPAVDEPASGDTVDMLCPMCDSIVAIPVERPIHVKCPKCSEEYYFAE